MAVQRIEWVCPGCERTFAIPAGAPQPALCPKCAANVPASPEPDIAPKVAPVPSRVSAQVKRHKYPALRLVSFLCKIEAVLIVVVTLFLVGAGILELFETDIPEERSHRAMFAGGCLLGGTFAALVQWAVAELILVLLDIEENTRPH